MIKSLLFKYQEKRQLLIAIFGALLGVTFLISSVHYLNKINEYGEDSEILGKNTLIIQKKVTSSSSLGLTKTDFTEKEISKSKRSLKYWHDFRKSGSDELEAQIYLLKKELADMNENYEIISSKINFFFHNFFS